MRDAAKDFTFVLDDIEGLVNACQHAFGPDDDPDHHWPDEEDVSHPPTGITFGMIRRRGWPWRRSDVHSPDAASVPAEPCVDCTHDYCRCAAREGVAALAHETATQRGDRVERDAVKRARPILRRQFELALGMIGRKARDDAAGVAPMTAWSEAVGAGLDRRIADYAIEVRRGD